MEKVLNVKRIGNEYQVFEQSGLDRPLWTETCEECAAGIKEYRRIHPGAAVRFENVYGPDEMKIRKLAGI